jgi:uncharacterized SAM-binding protein YcdF (DUF218 family)
VIRSRFKLALLLLVALFVAAFLLVSCQMARRIELSASGEPLRKADCIVVFGAAEYSGHPSPVLKARLDHALLLFDQGWAPIVITTGGAGLDPVYSEGGVGRDYLTRHGIPDVNLIGETQSSDTAESADRVSKIMLTNGLHSALVVSDAYHMFRIQRMMRKAGVEAIAAPRPDSLPKTAWGRFEGVSREVISFWAWKLHIT